LQIQLLLVCVHQPAAATFTIETEKKMVVLL
jgi:hypothetical protein